MSSDNGSSAVIYLMIAGPTLVFAGLRKLKEKRLLENTPRSKVRSAAMGVVELQGMAQPLDTPLKSPVTQRPCSWWHCRVEELRSSGRTSSWVTIHQTDAHRFFYFKDETGQVLVNPTGAELRGLRTTEELNSSTRTQLAPVLADWGLNDMNWFGGTQRLRLIEEVIGDGVPLMVLGELVSLSEPAEAREMRFRGYLDKVKRDAARMAEADSNKDGSVDGDEWDAFRARLRDEFDQAEAIHEAQNPSELKQIIQLPAQEDPFIISTEGPDQMERSLGWWAPLALTGGVAASAAGVWLAEVQHWPMVFVLGCVVVGFGISLFSNSKGEFMWRL